MRAVIQRVKNASVSIDDKVKSSIEQGLVIFLGVESADSLEDAEWLAHKIAGMRIFSDSDGKMNLSLNETGGGVLIISQFTLHASTKKGNRPSFIHAAHPDQAVPLYEAFIREMNNRISAPAATGKFGADMQVALINDGPVTIWMDTKNKA